jgi:hypothetical protein
VGHASISVKIDKTAPVTTVAPTSPPDGDNGWFITVPVTIDTFGTDALSGLLDSNCTIDRQFSSDTSGLTVFGTCTDNAGNSSSSSYLLKIDTTDPVASLIVTDGVEGTNGWYTSRVVLEASGTDNVSGPVVCVPPTQELVGPTDTDGEVVTAVCTNQAGRSVNLSKTIKIDKTPPITTVAASAPPNGANGWYTQDITVLTTCLEDVSIPVVGTAPQVITQETASLIVQGTCTNAAGLWSTNSTTVKLDKTAPTDVDLAVVSGTLGEDGWYTSDIVVRTTGQDNISGPVTCTAEQPWTDEEDEPGHQFDGSCTNLAGLTTDAAPLLVKIDKTAPTDVVLTPTGTLGNNGWYVSDVVVTTTGVEDVSDPMVCTPEQTLQVDTIGQLFNGSCENAVGLTGIATALTVKRDVTPPTMVLTVPAAVELGSASTATVVATDVTSGVASASCGAMDTSTTGTHSVTCTATDNAGNVATQTVAFEVLNAGVGSADCGNILFGTLPPAGGGYGTFAFSCGSLNQLLAASGCPASTSTFFYNSPGHFMV